MSVGIYTHSYGIVSYSYKYDIWVHVILREANFSVGLVAACRWPILNYSYSHNSTKLGEYIGL